MLNKSVVMSLKFAALPDDTCRLMATFIIAHLDVRGVFHGRPGLVRSAIFPEREDITTAQVARYLEAMQTAGLIQLFTAHGSTWQFWPGFVDNQIGLRTERETTDFPPPPSSGNLPEDIRQPADDAPEDVQQKDKDKEKGSLNEVQGEGEARARALEPDPKNPVGAPNTPPPPRKKASKSMWAKSEDERMSDPRVAAFTEIFGLERKLWLADIDAICEKVPAADLAKWTEALKGWAAAGYAVSFEDSMDKVISYFHRRKRTNPAGAPAPPGRRGTTQRLPQVEYTPEKREAARLAAKARLEARRAAQAAQAVPSG
jgi:hypothetical protein